ncbi:MAG: DUF479 domain-containing protein [Flavobacteriales bacterium]|nr:DUF479 domain-containing protein [Flavobacteriales bacterium]
MNYLAHLFLSGEDVELMFGNFIGDSVKGGNLSQYSSRVQDGIRLHRAIDQYTDAHHVVMKSKERLRPKYHKYAPVIVDMFYDHFLASLWEDYSEIALDRYIQNCYDLLLARIDSMPKRAQFMLPYMIDGNWLLNYKDLEGLNRALTGLAERSSFKSNMEHATADLERDYGLYKEEFSKFLPDLMGFVKNLKAG